LKKTDPPPKKVSVESPKTPAVEVKLKTVTKETKPAEQPKQQFPNVMLRRTGAATMSTYIPTTVFIPFIIFIPSPPPPHSQPNTLPHKKKTGWWCASQDLTHQCSARHVGG